MNIIFRIYAIWLSIWSFSGVKKHMEGLGKVQDQKWRLMLRRGTCHSVSLPVPQPSLTHSSLSFRFPSPTSFPRAVLLMVQCPYFCWNTASLPDTIRELVCVLHYTTAVIPGGNSWLNKGYLQISPIKKKKKGVDLHQGCFMQRDLERQTVP